MRLTTPRTLAAVAVTAAAFAFSTPITAFAADDPGHQPYAPFRIAEGLYYVGGSDYASYMITAKGGLIVVDGGDATVGKQVVANIRKLGFDPGQVKVLLNTHQHFDHAGGLAEIRKAAPGAKFYASAADGAIIAAGGRGDPYLKGNEYYYEPLKPDATLSDGQKITFGGWTLTAHITAGHTKGCTTWTFPVTVDGPDGVGKVRQALIHCSSSLLAGYKVGKVETYPGQTADYERSYATWKALACEVFLGSHGVFYDMQAKRKLMDAGKSDAFVDPAGCKAYYAGEEAKFRAELKKQNP